MSGRRIGALESAERQFPLLIIAWLKDEAALSKGKIQKIARYTFFSLPLLGVVAANLMPISIRSHQFLVMIVLIWLQVFFVFEIFFAGR